MALKRRIKKLSKSMRIKATGRVILTCSICEKNDIEVPADISHVTCGRCVQAMVAPPEEPNKKIKSTRPKGWQFKRLYEEDGLVYSRGKLISDPELISELRNPVKVVKPAKTTVKAKSQTGKKRGRPRKNTTSKSKNNARTTK